MTDALKPEDKDALLAMLPLSRFGTVSDVASAVLFLSGKDSSYITGQVISVNGGLYL